jgi:hypothetical protein
MSGGIYRVGLLLYASLTELVIFFQAIQLYLSLYFLYSNSGSCPTYSASG